MLSLQRSCLCAACLLAAAALLVLPPVAAAQKSAQPERPFVKGVLIGNNVNVRQGPGSEYPVYYKAAMDEEIKVVARQNEWLEIEFPAKTSSWISKDYLQKIDENTGIVTAQNVHVRAGPGMEFDINYAVPVGHKFKIIELDIKGAWYRVEPMPEATAWITSEFVKLAGPLPGEEPPAPPVPVPAPSPPTETPGAAPAAVPAVPVETYAAKMKDADEAIKTEIAKEDPLEWNLEKIEALYKDVQDNADDALLKMQAANRLKYLNTYKSIKERAIKLGKVDDDLRARLADLEKQRLEEIAAAEVSVASPYIAAGKLEKFYIPGIGNATHKLLRDNNITYLLRSEVLDLAKSEGKECGVRGKIIALEGVKVKVIDVTTVAPLPGQQ